MTCERSQGWAGLGRTTTGAGTMLLCADPRQGAGATGPQSSILQFCPDIFVFLTISPRQWRSRLKQSIVDILPWGLRTACCVDNTAGKQRSRISACHKSVHFNALLGYIPFHILILWFWFSNCIHIRKNIKNINHRYGQDSSSAAGLYSTENPLVNVFGQCACCGRFGEYSPSCSVSSLSQDRLHRQYQFSVIKCAKVQNCLVSDFQ